MIPSMPDAAAMPELVSFVLHLSAPGQPLAEKALPSWWGSAANRALLSALSALDADLARDIHDENGPRPFTVSSLFGRFGRGQPSTGETCYLRVSGLRADISAALLRAIAPGGPFSPGSEIELDHLPFQVQSVATLPHEHAWAGQTDYQKLAAGYLAASQAPPRQIQLELASPTAFHSNGRAVPFPMPEYVFGSLLDRWNSFSPLAFPPDLRRQAADTLIPTHFELRAARVKIKDGMQSGATGKISYLIQPYDRYWACLFHILAAFARYSGVGIKTTFGMGQVHPID